MRKTMLSILDFYQHPGLSPGDLERIKTVHVYQELKKGTLLLKEGQRANGYYCIGSGLIRSFATNPGGKDISTGFMGPGQIAIEVASLFLGIPTEENFQTLSNCRVWKIQLVDFQTLFDQVPAFAAWGRDWMSQSLMTHKLRALRMITETARERYLRLQREQPEILQKVPLKHIASYLGITDTSLSRIRKDFSAGT